VESVHRGSLRTTVHELGLAFAGTGPDLQRIIDTGTSFIHTANRNMDATTALLRDGTTVLRGQVASSSAIRSFARDLRLFSGTLAGHDRDLRRVIDNGSVTATQLRTFLDDNRVDLADLINNLVTTGDIVVKHLAGIRQVLVIYPYVVQSGFTVVSKSPETGLYDAHFGLVLTNDPTVCHRGYQGTDTRPPQDGSNRPMNVGARCTEPAAQSDARGAQHAPSDRPAATYRPPVAAYDPATGRLTWGGHHLKPTTTDPGSPAPATLGEESWRWLLLQPLTPASQ
jgi:phospholipid/cholesterol/gamma-HCH transport system substrate-binding protein